MTSFFAGGGVRGGAVIGASDKLAAYPVSDRQTPENLAAMYGSGAHLFRHTHAEGHGHLHEPGE